MLGEDDEDRIREEMNAAVTGVLAKHERCMTTKWVVLADVIDEDGVRWLWALGSSGATAWDIKGLLLQALDVERAKTVADYLTDE